MSISGLVLGFTKGWALAFCVLALAPILGVMVTLFGIVLTSGITQSLIAYGQSAGYAEQALSAIKVVTAFGMETQEKLNYTKYLEQAKKAGFNARLFGGAVAAFFFMVIFGSYAYAFYIGSQFIYHDVYNSA
jgi:ABC-type multidrug transport system fused ATPase/permease subunit